MRRVLLGLTVAVVWTVPAHAAVPQPFNPQVAFQRAQQHFGQTAACGTPRVTYEDMSNDDGVAWVSPFTDCEVHVAGRETWYPSWRNFCVTMIHEYGHLLGYEHSADPWDVMSPGTVRDDRAAAPECFPPRRKALRIGRVRIITKHS